MFAQAVPTGVIGGGNLTGLVMALLLGTGVIVLLMSFARRYKRCPSNKILVIYGKTGNGVARCIHGGASFVWPLIQAYEYLDLEPFVVPIDLKSALSAENIRVTVPTTVTAAISTESGVMENAAIRLLGLTDQQIRDQAQDIILGQMRSVIATMRIEEINQDRQAFLSKVNEAVSGELEKIGLHLVNVNIKDIEDDSGYIVALGRRAAAEAINQANIDVAEQEKKGQIGVATRQRDQRVAVSAANAEAEVGEAEADRNRRARAAHLS
jgi:flotillin